MALFEFEIQGCIKITVEGDTAEEARRLLVEQPARYEAELAKDCSISDGEEVTSQ